VTADTVTIGWVGDSRAYWLPDQSTPEAATPNAATPPVPGGASDKMVAVDYRYPARLTVDDSMAGQLTAAGKPMPEDVASSITGALLRWLGADAPDTRPHLLAFCPPVPGRVLVCSDGLFRYRPEPGDLAAATPAGDPLTVSRSLVQLALDAGGVDNIAVAVLPYPPSPSTGADITESGPAGREHRESP
jgi:serine/threonine protein phosphatase PrpC